jgi:hypothetical protein
MISISSRCKLPYIPAAPTFLVTDVGKTARWYEQHLGFTVATFPKQEPYGAP